MAHLICSCVKNTYISWSRQKNSILISQFLLTPPLVYKIKGNSTFFDKIDEITLRPYKYGHGKK